MTGSFKWEEGVVNYNFVSNGKDSLKDAAFFVDENIGFSQSEMAIFKKAMMRIESATCIRFKRSNPDPDKKWILIMREGTATTCMVSYINENIKDKEVGNLGKVRY